MEGRRNLLGFDTLLLEGPEGMDSHLFGANSMLNTSTAFFHNVYLYGKIFSYQLKFLYLLWIYSDFLFLLQLVLVLPLSKNLPISLKLSNLLAQH